MGSSGIVLLFETQKIMVAMDGVLSAISLGVTVTLLHVEMDP